ncbi:SCAR-like protein 2 [Acorus calamus]|uniref:Protein SCAR n=1 Tax=Acorus calamus TaxID=4465 RepID=A0AAV9DN92_ACOCL|nr:SCAR-like protein 2 [Acorus calamus]
MPLVRFELKNEYGLGDRVLYRAAATREDPKAVLEGVAVAGLVGILRQLGDLAEFAAEIFHDVHEQVTITAARGRKMMARIKQIEYAVPSLEKSILTQTSHIHFAYTPGSDWHVNIQEEQNHFNHSDLPQLIMDSYEECRDPPCLYLLDRFDSGSPGVCLKRYTDPSYFRGVFATSGSMKEETSRGKKSYKLTKKHQRRKREAPEPSLMYSDSLASDTVSTSDSRVKSELASRSTSFDFKSGLGYIEQVMGSNSNSYDEMKQNELFTQFNVDHSDEDSIECDEKIQDAPDVCSTQESLLGQSAKGPSSVSWDEKTEIIKPTCSGSQHDVLNDEVRSDSLPMSFELSSLESEGANTGNVDQEDILLDIEKMQHSSSSRNHFDEITSETDNYMDALNTLESETETDSECQTKREVERQCIFNPQQMNLRNSGINTVDGDKLSSSISQHGFLNEEVPPEIFQSTSPESSYGTRAPHVSGVDSVPRIHDDDGSCEFHALDASRLACTESVLCDPPSVPSILNKQTNSSSETDVDPSKLQECSTDVISGVPTVKFWTNGSLLGLEPSKPPDLSVSNMRSDDTVAGLDNDRIQPPNASVVPKLNQGGSVREMDESILPIGYARNSFPRDESKLSPKNIRSSSLPVSRPVDAIKQPVFSTHSFKHMPETKAETQESHSILKSGGTHANDSVRINVLSFPDELPVLSNIEVPDTDQSKSEVSSAVSGLGSKFIENGHQRRTLSTNGVCEPQHKHSPCEWTDGQVDDVEFQHSDEQEPKEKLGYEILENCVSPKCTVSGDSSPPLEHMKISFLPINGLETSKLKLEYSNGEYPHEHIEGAMFPSFQLLPKPAILVQDVGSDSDDDTFCKSSQYPSEDLLSPRSDSNSELWDHDERTESNYMSDNPHRVSSAASTFSSYELEGETHISTEFGRLDVQNCVYSDASLDLPTLDNMISVSSHEGHRGFPTDDPSSEFPTELPPPPPLPPLQWRITRTQSSLFEEYESVTFEGVSQTQGLQVPRPLSHQPTVPLAPNPPLRHMEEAAARLDKSIHNQMTEGQGESNQGVNGNGVDETDDFLHQIRTKSFSLRRTVTSRPSFAPAPTANVKVAAILEKANAIRQACVGSDEGGDTENWSDD